MQSDFCFAVNVMVTHVWRVGHQHIELLVRMLGKKVPTAHLQFSSFPKFACGIEVMRIYLETDKGGARKALKPGDAPEACFALCNETPVAVYAYCNLHGLWKA